MQKTRFGFRKRSLGLARQSIIKDIGDGRAEVRWRFSLILGQRGLQGQGLVLEVGVGAGQSACLAQPLSVSGFNNAVCRPLGL